VYLTVCEGYIKQKSSYKRTDGSIRPRNETKVPLLEIEWLFCDDNRARLLPRNPIFAGKSFEISPFFVLQFGTDISSI
jgi:hypothetical protein